MKNDRLRELLGEGNGHFSAEQLGLLLEQILRGAMPLEVAEHLTKCRRCFATFAELARTRAKFDISGPAEKVPADLLELGRAIAGPPPLPISPPYKSSRSRRPWPRIRAPMTIAAAAIILVLAGLLLFKPFADSPRDMNLISTIQTAVAMDSQYGLVHHGCGNLETEPLPVYRNGDSQRVAGARAALSELARQYREASPPADVAYWLTAGYISLSELSIARSFLEEARRLHPEDPRFTLLASHLAYKKGDLSTAQELLAELAKRYPDDGVILLDLGLVMRERNQPEAAQQLDLVQRRFTKTFLARRARAALSPHDS